MIAGLYPYARGGEVHEPRFTLAEIPLSLEVNTRYRKELLVLAGDRTSAGWLEAPGLDVYRVFDDAPARIQRDAAHLMKHWMCRWALAEFGEFLWIDWDTVCLRWPDDEFWSLCRSGDCPRFIRIPDYRATVNCGVYYCPGSWMDALDRSFDAVVQEPNDELHWAAVLPADVRQRDEFWWARRVVNVWTEDDLDLLGPDSCFAHIKDLRWADRARVVAGAGRSDELP